MRAHPYTATFVVPVNRTAADNVEHTAESILAFRQHAYQNEANCHIICVGDIVDEDRLRKYATKRKFCPGHDILFSVYPVSAWPELEQEFLMPAIAAYLNAAAARILNEVVIVVGPETQFHERSNSALLDAIDAVGKNEKLLVVGTEGGSTKTVLAVFNARALENRGIAIKAADGVPAVCEKRFLGGPKFVRSRREVPQDLAWLIAAIGLHYQDTNGMSVTFAALG